MNYSESVVLYGGSVIWGKGLEPDDRLAAQLTALTSRPIVNLSYPGSSSEFALVQQQRLRHQHGTPWMEIVCWTETLRFYHRDRDQHHGIWTLESWPPGMASIHDQQHWDQRTLDYRCEFRAQAASRLFELAVDRPVWELMPDVYHWDKKTWQDITACRHPGARSVRALAQHLAQVINSH